MSRRRQFDEPPPLPDHVPSQPVALACARGCVSRGRHVTACLCTPECPKHPDHCTGCFPRPATVGRLCDRCAGSIVAALAVIPELAVHAASRRDGKLSPARTSSSDPTRRGTPAPPSLSPAWDAAEEAIQWAHRTALACADANDHRGPFRYRCDGVPARALTETITYIRQHIGWYATHAPAEIYAEATGLKRKLERVSGHDHLTHRIHDPCPQCGQKALVREDGSNQVICRNRECGRVWREHEYDWLAHVATA